MSASIQQGASASTNNNVSGCFVPVPSTTIVGDLLVAMFGHNRSQSISRTGWTAISNLGRGSVLWKIADSSDSALAGSTMTFTTNDAVGQSSCYAMVRITGYDTSDPIPSGTVYTGTTGGLGPITPTADDLLIGSQGANDNNATSFSWTNQSSTAGVFFINESGGNDASLVVEEARGDGTNAVTCTFPNTVGSSEASTYFLVKSAPPATLPDLRLAFI